ncbi:hypothetical protein FQR65_LT16967 [Abscondita terminalis]|nr:hypothetical protein FQR65_LT16967 [Abscondita terminalis]
MTHSISLSLLVWLYPFLFYYSVFPRFAQFWQIPIPNNQAVTGLSDRMSPGDIASLSQSSALAFRIIGDMKQFPSRNELYWRAMVLDRYDGTTWTSDLTNKQSKSYAKIAGQVDGFHYRYLASDPSQQWITGLEKSIPIEQRFELHQDWSITPKRLVQRVQPIELQWIGQRIQDVQAPAFEQLMLKNNLKYPKNRDLQAQKFAVSMFRQSQENPDIYIQNILNWYKKENFVYTLASGGNWGITELMSFYFNQNRVSVNTMPQALFCLALLSNTALGSSQVIRAENLHLTEKVGKYHSSVLRTLRVWSDYASFQWQSKVVGYDAEKQSGWMKKLGLTSVYSYGLVLIFGIIGLLLLYWGVTKLFRVRQMSELERLIFKFNQQLPELNQKAQFETFQQWMSRLASEVEEKSSFEQANQVFQKITYLANENQQDIQKFKKLLKECSNALKAKK